MGHCVGARDKFNLHKRIDDVIILLETKKLAFSQ